MILGGEYQADTRSFFITCPKSQLGQHFEGLDMITKLLTPPGNRFSNTPDVPLCSVAEPEPPGAGVVFSKAAPGCVF